MCQFTERPHNPAERQPIGFPRVVQRRRANVGNFHQPVAAQFTFPRIKLFGNQHKRGSPATRTLLP